MGITGTDISQQCADIILSGKKGGRSANDYLTIYLDDNFEHILAAIEEGRRTYDNIFKFALYLLSCNSAEIFIILISIAANFPIPFTYIQLQFTRLLSPSCFHVFDIL